jgi:hypothetical protein
MVNVYRSHEGQLVEYRPVSMRICTAPNLLGSCRDGPIHTPHYRLWHSARQRGRTLIVHDFNRAIRGQALPKYLSSDHDPLYRYHQWQANLRVLEVSEIKTVPYVPLSHPFVERLIGSIRREFLDQMLFWRQQTSRTSLLVSNVTITSIERTRA